PAHFRPSGRLVHWAARRSWPAQQSRRPMNWKIWVWKVAARKPRQSESKQAENTAKLVRAYIAFRYLTTYLRGLASALSKWRFSFVRALAYQNKKSPVLTDAYKPPRTLSRIIRPFPHRGSQEYSFAEGVLVSD